MRTGENRRAGGPPSTSHYLSLLRSVTRARLSASPVAITPMRRALIGLVASAAWFAAVADAQVPADSCRATAAGLACTRDAGGDGVPDRIVVYPTNGRALVVFQYESRPGGIAAEAGTAGLPGGGRAIGRAEAWDVNGDGFAERRDARVDAFGPSNVGAWAAVTVLDAASNGLPDRVNVAASSPQRGDVWYSIPMNLP